MYAPLPTFETYGHLVGDYQSGVNVNMSDFEITGTLKFIEGGLAPSGYLAGDGNFLALKLNVPDIDQWEHVNVGLDPSQGSGLVDIKGDPDMVVVCKITDNTTQDFKVVCTKDGTTDSRTFDLSKLVCESEA